MFPSMYPGDMMTCPNTPWISLEDWEQRETKSTAVTKLKYRPVVIIGRSIDELIDGHTYVEYTVFSSSVGILRSACRIKKT